MSSVHDEDEKYKYLLKENGIIRKGLREMNDFLSDFIDHLKEQKLKKIHSMGYKYGNHGKLKKTKEDKLEILTAEFKNYENMLANLTEEREKFSNRMSQVTDHKYVLALRQEVENTKEHITQMQKYFVH